MTWVDLLIGLIIVLSAVVSLWRGFVRELISLVTWVAAFWVAIVYAQGLDGRLERFIDTASVRLAVAFFALFVGTLLVGALINHFAGVALQKSGLKGTDRGLGIIFGSIRGVLIVTVLVMLAGMTAIPDDPWWQQSALLPWFERVAVWLSQFLPADLSERFTTQ